jgi:hypothetical protein
LAAVGRVREQAQGVVALYPEARELAPDPDRLDRVVLLAEGQAFVSYFMFPGSF